MYNLDLIGKMLWGRASKLLVEHRRIWGPVASWLSWQCVYVGLRYVKGALDHADCVSR